MVRTADISILAIDLIPVTGNFGSVAVRICDEEKPDSADPGKWLIWRKIKRDKAGMNSIGVVDNQADMAIARATNIVDPK